MYSSIKKDYNHLKVERKWQKYWLENHTYRFENDNQKPKFYVLDMFPYPSGKGLHVGHPKGYTATDIVSRYKRLKGFNVLHPIGWDAFGLPAEQYALETGNHPATFTQNNIQNFRNQLQTLGFDFDYDKEVDTTDPRYFKWTQWTFEQLYKHGLAELKEIEVNWCEGLGTVLANEEVLIDKNGNKVSERGSFPVVRKPMKQWVLKITKYADKLLDGLETLDWSPSLKALQTNWIGRTRGYAVNVAVQNKKLELECFTSRLDAIYGASFIAVAAKAPFISQLITPDQQENVTKFLDEFNNLTDRKVKELALVDGAFTGSYGMCPITHKLLPIYVVSYVTNTEGTGIKYGIPCANKDDLKFAQQANLEIIDVLQPSNQNDKMPYEDGTVINSNDQLNNLSSADAYQVVAQMIEQNHYGKEITTYKLRDWLFSRQRYWGEPFPIYFDDQGDVYLVPENQLPLTLPTLSTFKPSGDGQSPLANATDWVNFELDNKHYKRDTNTMPQWAGSCWYYLGYILKQPDGSYLDLNSDQAKELFARWMPVDLYIGGQEHAVLHLLYARFWYHFLYDIGIVSNSEPFQKIVNQGMILGPDGEKMSKSKGNIINPDDVISTHGADALRLYEAFMGPLTATLPWDDAGLDGMKRWIERIYRSFIEKDTLFDVVQTESELKPELVVAYNDFVKKLDTNLAELAFNVGISNMMIFLNQVYETKQFYGPYMDNFLIVLSCYAPHIAEELWHENHSDCVGLQTFPTYDNEILENQKISIPVMIANKPRAVLSVAKDTDCETLTQLTLSHEKVQAFLKDKQVVKVIPVLNKIVNIIVK